MVHFKGQYQSVRETQKRPARPSNVANTVMVIAPETLQHRNDLTIELSFARKSIYIASISLRLRQSPPHCTRRKASCCVPSRRSSRRRHARRAVCSRRRHMCRLLSPCAVDAPVRLARHIKAAAVVRRKPFRARRRHNAQGSALQPPAVIVRAQFSMIARSTEQRVASTWAPMATLNPPSRASVQWRHLISRLTKPGENDQKKRYTIP